MDVDVIVRMGFFIDDLHRGLDHLHKQQFSDPSSMKSFTVYRGQGLSKTDFDELMKCKDGLLSFNSFLSASKEWSVSAISAESSAGHPDLVGILFVIRVDPAQFTTPFACISGISQYHSEAEVLFSMHTVFRISNIQPSIQNGQVYEVGLSLTTDDDPELRTLTDCIREKSYPKDEGWCRLGLVFMQMGEFDKAGEIYEILLNQTTSAIQRGYIFDRLGSIKNLQGQLEEANKMFEQSRAILRQSLPPYHLSLAASLNNIAVAYSIRGDYSKALSSYENALAILQKSLPPNHPDSAVSYDNIAGIYVHRGDYPNALSFYEKAFAIRQQSLSPNNPDLASSFSNIGVVYTSLGDYQKALSSHERALAIRQQSLPAYHPDLAASFVNIGVVYTSLGDYQKALPFNEKALAIEQQSLPPDHPDLVSSYNNIGLIYNKLGDYQKALSSHERALAIRQQSFPPNHPDLALSYNNIARVYADKGDYQKALSFRLKALAIQQPSLPSKQPS